MANLWLDLCGSRAFWLDYLSPCVLDFRGCPTLRADSKGSWDDVSCSVTLQFGLLDEHKFRMQIGAGEHRLFHLDYETPPQLLGWMDSHRMNQVFRLSEFHSVVRWLDKLISPSWANRLLFSIYVGVAKEQADQYAAMLREVLTASKLFSDSEVEYVLNALLNPLLLDCRWRQVPNLGWIPEGECVYTLRKAGGDFDWPRFERLLSAIGHVG